MLVYVTSFYPQNTWFYSPVLIWRDRGLYLDQTTIIRCLTGLAQDDGVEAVVKVNPTTRFMEPPWVEGLADTPVRVVKEFPSFKTLIEKADVIVIDHPATTILEALCTRAPVFVLLRHFRHPPKAVSWLKKRAVCADNAEELVSKLAAYFQEGVYPADLDDETFLKAFSDIGDERAVAGRALNVIEELTFIGKGG